MFCFCAPSTTTVIFLTIIFSIIIYIDGLHKVLTSMKINGAVLEKSGLCFRARSKGFFFGARTFIFTGQRSMMHKLLNM
jgi:hypothetical protein